MNRRAVGYARSLLVSVFNSPERSVTRPAPGTPDPFGPVCRWSRPGAFPARVWARAALSFRSYRLRAHNPGPGARWELRLGRESRRWRWAVVKAQARGSRRRAD